MKRFLSFVLGLIFGIVFLLGTFGIAMYASVTVVHPNEIYADLENYLGDLGDVSLLQAYYNILELYNNKTGGITDGDLYSVGEFLADNHISSTNEETGEVTAFGVVMPKALLDAPLFEYFNNNVDGNGDTGVQRALRQIKLSAVPSLVNMFTPEGGNKPITDEVTAELDQYSVYDLVYGENKTESGDPNIVANLATITQNIKLVHLIPSLHAEEETENFLTKVLSAVGEASIGALITDLTGNNNIFGMLNADGSLSEVGKLSVANILGGSDPLISSMLGDITISDFVADNGNISITPAMEKISIGGLFGLVKRPVEAEIAKDDVTNYYQTNDDDTKTYVWSVAIKDGKYYISTDAEGEGVTPTWYEGMLVCEESHEHVDACFDYVWYIVCKKEAHTHNSDCPTDCEIAEHSHEGEYVVGETNYVPVDKSSIYRTIASLNMGALMDESGAINFANLFKKFDNHKLDAIVNELLADNEILKKLSSLLKMDEMTLSELLGEGGFDKLFANVTNVPIKDILATFDVTGMESITDMIGDMSISELASGGFSNISLGDILGLVKRDIAIDLTSADIIQFTTATEEGATIVELAVAKVGEQYYLSTNYPAEEETTSTWYEGMLVCKNEAHVAFDDHTKDCFEYVLYQKCTNESEEHSHADDAFTKTEEQEGGTPITIGYVKASVLYNTLGNMTIGSIMSGGISSLFNDLKDMKLGELLEMFGMNSESSGIMNTLKDLTINELMNGGYKSLQLGEILGYVHYENTDARTDHGRLFVDGEGNTIGQLGETVSGKMVLSTDGTTWYNAKLTCKVEPHTHIDSCGTEGAYTCGKEAHDHVFGCYGKIWYQECAELHNHSENDAFSKTKDGVEIWYAEVTGLYDTLASMTIGSIMDGGISSLFSDLKDMTLGELLKTFGMGDEMSGIMNTLKDLTLDELMSGGYNSLLLGEILSYERAEYNGTTTITAEETFTKGDKTIYVATVGGQLVISADGTTWYDGKLTCKVEPHTHVDSCGTEGAYTCGKEAHDHGFDCYGYVWYQECTNKDADHDHSGELKKTKEQDGLPIDVWYVEVTGMYDALAGLTIGDLTAGGDVMNTLLGKLTLGDVMQSNLPPMLESLKDTPISQLSGAIDTVKVGDFVGFKRSEVDVAGWGAVIDGSVYQHTDERLAKIDGTKYYLAELTCEESHTHPVDCYTCIWYAKDGVTPLGGVEKALADKVIDDLSDFKSILNDLTLGDVMSPVPDILKSLANTPINELNTAIESLYVGELLGYKKGGDIWYKKCENAECTETSHTHKQFDGHDYAELTGIEKVLAGKKLNDLKDMNKILDEVTLGEVMQDNLPDMLKSLKDVKISELGTKMNELYVGELLGYKKDGDVWYKKCENAECTETSHTHKQFDGQDYAELTGIEKVLAGKTINELQDMNAIFNDVTLGDVMQDNLPDMLKSLADTPISGLSGALDGLYVGEMLKYTRTLDCGESHDHTDDCYKWLNEGAPVDGMMAKIANKKVGNMGTIGNDIQGYSIGDIMGRKDSDSAIIKALYDTPVGDIGTKMNDIQLGTAMGYYSDLVCAKTHTHGKGCYIWYTNEEHTTTVGAPQKAFVDYTLSGIGAGISNITLGELVDIDDTSSSMLKALKDTPINGIGTAINGIALGTSMGYVRNEITNITSYTTHVVADQVMANGTDPSSAHFVKELDNTWYEAVFGCKDTHEHTADCYDFVWYEKCAEGCTDDTHAHAHAVIDSAKHVKVGGLNAKMSNLTVGNMGGEKIIAIIQNLSMRDMIDSGVLTFNDEQKFKLAIMFGCSDTEHQFTKTIAFSAKVYKCNIGDYLMYKTTNTSVTAEIYYRKTHSIDEDTSTKLTEEQLVHRDKWQDCTLNEFINALLNGI